MAEHRVDAAALLTFLDGVDADDLWAWLDLRPGCDVDAITEAVRVQRRWAQAQQNNPRHRQTARWIIRNARAVEALLATDPVLLEALDVEIFELRRRRARRLLRQLGEDPDAVETLTHAQNMKAPVEDDTSELSTLMPTAPKGQVTYHVDTEQILAHAQSSGMPRAMLDGLVTVWRDQGLSEQQIAVMLLDELNLRVPGV